MTEIIRIRISNGNQSQLLTKVRRIHTADLEKYRRRLSRLFHAEIDFTYKNKPAAIQAHKTEAVR